MKVLIKEKNNFERFLCSNLFGFDIKEFENVSSFQSLLYKKKKVEK